MTIYRQARSNIPWLVCYLFKVNYCFLKNKFQLLRGFHGLVFNTVALRKAKMAYNFGLSEGNRVKRADS